MPNPIIKHRYTDFGKDKLELAKYSVNYKDVFSMGTFYSLLHEWLVDEGYAPRADDKFQEISYVQRENPALGKEVWVRWRLSKIPDEASKLWRYDLDIDMHTLGLKEVEFVHKGAKLKADKGEVEVAVVANLILDYEKAWAKHPWLKNYKEFIINKLLRSKFGLHKKTLFTDAMRFQEAIKTYLKIETYLEAKEFEEFHPKRPPE